MKKLNVENESFFLCGLEEGSSKEEAGKRFGPVFEVVHFIRAKGSYAYRPHTHPKFEMIVPLKGVYECLLNGERLKLSRGKALLVQPGDAHQDLYRPGMEYCGSVFDLPLPGGASEGRRIFRPGVEAAGRVAKLKSASSLLHAKAAFSGEAESGLFESYRAEAAVQACFWEALGSIPKRLLAPEFLETPERDAFRKRLAGLFEKAAGGRLSLALMAKSLGVSGSSLSHKCSALFGAPPAKAFLDFRLAKAKALLEERGLSVKAACEELGFASQFHFSRAFKRRYGAPPSSFK